MPRIWVSTALRVARWDDAASHVLDSATGTDTADVVVSANGLLSEPAIPHSEGLEAFTPTNEYLPAVAAADTELVTNSIERFTASGIVTRDGTARTSTSPTGFRVTDGTFPHLVTGKGRKTRRQVWDGDSMAAYNGTTLARFPTSPCLAAPTPTSATRRKAAEELRRRLVG